LERRQPDAKRAEFELTAPQKISPETPKATLIAQRGLFNLMRRSWKILKRGGATSLRPVPYTFLVWCIRARFTSAAKAGGFYRTLPQV
jgi:hypothetical protein